MATEGALAGALARLLLDKPSGHDEHSTPQLMGLWMEHLGEADDRDIAAACTAILADPQARFPTVGQFREEVQIQGRDRIRREIPPDVEGHNCYMCGGLGYVFVEGPSPFTVRPCEQCNEAVFELWETKHYRLNHVCSKCSAPMRRKNRASGSQRRTRASSPAPPDLTHAQGSLSGDF